MSAYKELATPAFLVDYNRVQNNAKMMFDKARLQQVRLRPHVKTHKTVQGALLQHGGKPGPVTVSTLAEARLLLSGGFKDILYAVPCAPDKLDYVCVLAKQCERFILCTDQPELITAASEKAVAQGVNLSLYIKIDSGAHRSGIHADDERMVEIATLATTLPGVEFLGIMTHAGQSYGTRSAEEARSIALHERDTMLQVKSRLEDAGLLCKEVSVGSTPACVHALDWEGVTEIRPGNYFFFDYFQHQIGSCALEQIGMRVLVSVIGLYPERETLVVDGGALCFSKDLGASSSSRPVYGYVLGHPELWFKSVSQEHGILNASKELISTFTLGQKLEIIPNHSCLTAACFEEYAIVEGQQVIDFWKPAKFWY